jgi:hypothetical protein
MTIIVIVHPSIHPAASEAREPGENKRKARTIQKNNSEVFRE